MLRYFYVLINSIQLSQNPRSKADAIQQTGYLNGKLLLMLVHGGALVVGGSCKLGVNKDYIKAGDVADAVTK